MFVSLHYLDKSKPLGSIPGGDQKMSFKKKSCSLKSNLFYVSNINNLNNFVFNSDAILLIYCKDFNRTHHVFQNLGNCKFIQEIILSNQFLNSENRYFDMCLQTSIRNECPADLLHITWLHTFSLIIKENIYFSFK